MSDIKDDRKDATKGAESNCPQCRAPKYPTLKPPSLLAPICDMHKIENLTNELYIARTQIQCQKAVIKEYRELLLDIAHP